MRRAKLIWNILKINRVREITAGYLSVLAAVILILWLWDPGIVRLGDAVWYCFSVVTTAGFGDVTVVSAVGRAATIVLGLYSLFFVALITGVTVNYFQETLKLREKESIVQFLDELERLPELSREELEELSRKVKAQRTRGKR